MKYEWDRNKAAANKAKHGVGFDMIQSFDWLSADCGVDIWNSRTEIRFRGLGLIGDRVYHVVYTDRLTDRRIISLRKANQRETKRYKRYKNG